MSVQSVLFVHRPSNCYPLIGLYLLCTACASHRACSSFFPE